MTVTNVGCIYDQTTDHCLQLIVITDGADSELNPHRLQVGKGQAWLDIDLSQYLEPNFDINTYIAGAIG